MRRLFTSLAFLLLLHVACVIGVGLAGAAAPADVAVVLGSTVSPQGVLSERLEARVTTALALYREGLVERILVSGATGVEGVNEAEAMRDWLLAHDVPRRDILVDRAGFTTWDTAIHTREILSRERLHSVVVVTSYYHVARTRMALERAGVEVVGAQRAALIWEPREVWSVLREIAAIYAYALDGRV